MPVFYVGPCYGLRVGAEQAEPQPRGVGHVLHISGTDSCPSATAGAGPSDTWAVWPHSSCSRYQTGSQLRSHFLLRWTLCARPDSVCPHPAVVAVVGSVAVGRKLTQHT